MSRSILCKCLPATDTKSHRIKAYDQSFSEVYSYGTLRRDYDIGNEDMYEYTHLCRAAATQFMKDNYPNWVDEICFIHSIVKINGKEQDVFTTVDMKFNNPYLCPDFMTLSPSKEEVTE